MGKQVTRMRERVSGPGGVLRGGLGGVPEWVPWGVGALLVGLWLLVPGFSVEVFGGVYLRSTEVVRWVPLLVGVVVCWRAFLRWHWLDVAVVVWCLSPLVAGLVNGVPWGEAVWETVKEFSYWWVPFAVGRYLFVGEGARRALGWVVVMGAAVYLPLVLYEVFNGPTLASWVAGKDVQGAIAYGRRGETYKPTVFLSSGFVLTMFYVWAVMIATHRGVRGFWDWRDNAGKGSGGVARGYVGGVMAVVAVVLGAVVVVCKSLGSVALMGVGWMVMLVSRSRVVGGLLAILCVVPMVYIGVRTSGVVSTEAVHEVALKLTSVERAGSLRYRLQAEEIVFRSMAGHVWWGYGDWGRWSEGRPVMVLDGFWLFAWTRTGMVSVVAWVGMVTLPVMVVAVWVMRFGWKVARDWGFAGAVMMGLWGVDSMLNYFGEAPVMLCLGVITGWAVELLRGGGEEDPPFKLRTNIETSRGKLERGTAGTSTGRSGDRPAASSGR